jgi:hypothetical protein
MNFYFKSIVERFRKVYLCLKGYMNTKFKLTQKYLKECLDYNPETGIFKWKERPTHHFKDNKRQKALSVCKMWNTCHFNTIAGHKEKDNYISIVINGKGYRSHRLAFLYMEGYMPENMVDHIDQNPSNNKWNNLREVSNRCNQQNCKLNTMNTSGVTGVNWVKSSNKWKSVIMINGKTKYLGMYDDFDIAVMVRYIEEQNNPEWTCSVESTAFKYLKNKYLGE